MHENKVDTLWWFVSWEDLSYWWSLGSNSHNLKTPDLKPSTTRWQNALHQNHASAYFLQLFACNYVNTIANAHRLIRFFKFNLPSQINLVFMSFPVFVKTLHLIIQMVLRCMSRSGPVKSQPAALCLQKHIYKSQSAADLHFVSEMHCRFDAACHWLD